MWILRSYRWRRRLIFTGIVLGVAGPLIWLGVRYSQPGNPFNANGPIVANPVQAKDVPFTPPERRAVHHVLKQFISTAVVRHDPGKAWPIAGPTLKEGLTRKDWDRGDIPVVPYPAANKGWGDWSFVEYSQIAEQRTVGLEVYLFPKPKSGWSAMSADVEVVRKQGRWLVDYWMPKRFHGPPAVVKKVKTKTQKLRERHSSKGNKQVAAPAFQPEKPRARGAWWALPIGLLGLAVVLPLTIGGFVWYRNRKAERDYFRSVR
jgi:hypothetical protein